MGQMYKLILHKKSLNHKKAINFKCQKLKCLKYVLEIAFLLLLR
ncbi:hypothetical protein CCYN2B_280026 [Capnocytophaga cynodegmi]|uniref:Uncharacterized protein n=1 Tax=Capnocytophaga cynodegmi TaxID=28189 RepID=A0A0B7H7Y2_9FLAO|nr:hypothetical protein CCYN2B_280026 [Capnocytophaga cynodegmi]